MRHPEQLSPIYTLRQSDPPHFNDQQGTVIQPDFLRRLFQVQSQVQDIQLAASFIDGKTKPKADEWLGHLCELDGVQVFAIPQENHEIIFLDAENIGNVWQWSHGDRAAISLYVWG